MSEAIRSVALRIIEQEIPERAHLLLAPQALGAALELLPYPRAQWATPSGPWEEAVVAVAVAVLRTEGALNIPRSRAVQAVRAAVAGALQGQHTEGPHYYNSDAARARGWA